ncbi:hypothetical protein ABPG74_001436 [Tetrahymena malaccensis]
MYQDLDNQIDRVEYERKNEKSQSYISDQNRETVVYGRHFMTKPSFIFYSQEKKLIVNVLWSGLSIQTVPNNPDNLDKIKYKDIISVHCSPDKDNEVIIIFNNKQVAAGKNPQTQYNFKSDDRHLFISDYYRAIDTYYFYLGVKSIPNSNLNLNFVTIQASLIVDKSTKSYFESKLTCFNSHLTIEILRPITLSDKKFQKIKSSMFYTNSKSHQKQIKQSEDIQSLEQNQKAPQSNSQLGNNKNQSVTLVIKYRDILRISKKLNGFQINLSKPSLSMAFYLNDLNQVQSFVNRVQKNSKDQTKMDVSVTSTMQEEIHHIVKFNDQQMDVDFALYAGRVMPTKTHARFCILAIGKGGIFEVDQYDGEVYETYDLKYLKDIVRQEFVGAVRNSIKLIFFNGQEVEYVFEPYQRDLLIIEILTNINMYYDLASPCRRCLDMIHSHTPNYQLEIQGWKMENGTPDRDQDVDAELMKNIILAKGEDSFFSALREFNVNCNLKKTSDADLKIYHHIISVLSRYLSYFEDHDLLFFQKHIKFVKTIPQSIQEKSNDKQVSQLQLFKKVESEENTINTTDTSNFRNSQRRNSQESMLQHEHEHYEKFINIQIDALRKQVDEEYSSQKDHQNANQKLISEQFLLEEDVQSDDSDEIFVHEQSPMTRKNISAQKQGANIQLNLQTKNNPTVSPFDTETAHIEKSQSPNIHPYNRSGLNISQKFRFESEQMENINLKLTDQNRELKKLFQLCSHNEYSLQEYELMSQMRTKSVNLLKKLNKTEINLPNDSSQQSILKLNVESVEGLLHKIEEMLKCLTIFQNCKKYFEDKTIKQDKFKEFKSILQLLSNPDPLVVYQTSQLFKRVGFYHNNMMQKAETENKNFLLDYRFNILDRVFYQISNYTLIKRPLSQYTYMVRIYSMFSIINTLFQARIESTAPIHRQAIIYHLQSPVFFAAVSRILRYNSFALIVNSINLLNALYYFSTENKQFINMIILNSTMILFLLHIVIQDLYSSKQLKDIGFNLLFSLLNQRSQACYVIMNVFPKPLFKVQKTESQFVDQWTKQEWYSFFFSLIQTDIKQPHFFWLKQNLKILDEALIKEDKIFLHQQIFTVFKRINHVCDLQQFFPYLFRKDGNFGRAFDITPTHSSSLLTSSIRGNNQEIVQPSVSPQEADILNQIKELQKEIFTKLYWNIDDFKVEYENINDQMLCGRYYIKQIIQYNRRLQFDFVDAKNQILEKEIKELWENLISNLMNHQQKEKQALCLRTMTILYKEYSKVIKITNILPYLVHILNLHEYQVLQYSIVQLLLTVLNSEDLQAKQFHSRAMIDCNGIQQIVNVIAQRISFQEDLTEIPYGADATYLKLPEVRNRGDENLYIIFMCLKMISACIQMHSHIFRKREVYPLTKPQKVCFEKRNWRIMQNILLLKNEKDQKTEPQGIVRDEYLKLVYTYLMNDYMLHINGFCELLTDQISDLTEKSSFTIIKALFYRLPDARQILEEIVNGQGLQKRHIEVFPFFKFFPVQLLLVLLNDHDDEENGLFKSAITNPSGITAHYQPPQQTPPGSAQISSSSSQSQQITIPRDQGVLRCCERFRSDNEESYDLIWNKAMKSTLREKLGNFLSSYKDCVNIYYNQWFNPSKLVMTDYRIVTEDKINNYPIITQSFDDTVYYSQLKNEITSCQIFLRLWAKQKNDETELFNLPQQFALKTVQKIQQYSFQPDIFKVLNEKTSSAMKNLLHILKAQTKIYKNRLHVENTYPYNHILSILQTCTKIVRDAADDPDLLEDLKESALEDQTPSSPLLSQNKRNSFRKSSIVEQMQQSPSRASLFQPRKLSTSSIASASNLDMSFSTPLIDNISTTFNMYIKASLKVIYNTLKEVIKFNQFVYYFQIQNFFIFIKRKNLEAFLESSTGIECILYTLSNIIIQIQIKNINRQDIRNYFDDLSVSYQEIKIINLCVLILQEIYDVKKISLNQLSQQQRNDLCLLIQRAQKITVTFFHTFLEKYTGSLNSGVKEKYGNTLPLPQKAKSKEKPTPVLVTSDSTPSLLSLSTSLTSSQTVPASAANPQYKDLLDKLYNIDTDTIQNPCNTKIVEKFFKATRELNVSLSVLTLCLSKNCYFLESLIRGGCVWRAIEIILTKGKTFNTLQNNDKKYNTENLDEITKVYSKMLYFIIENSQFIKTFENGTQTISISLKPVQIVGNDNNQKDATLDISLSNSEKKNNQSGLEDDSQKKVISSSSLSKQDQKNQLQNSDSQSSLNDTPNQKIKGNWKNNLRMDSEILEEDQSRSDDRSSMGQNSRFGFSMYSKLNNADAIHNTAGKSSQINEGQENEESEEINEDSSPTRRRRKEDEHKEYLFHNMQLLREIGPIGRDKLMFFINQFLIALTRNVDNHLLKYLKERRFESFIRKINSNIELPDFIWNQISRDKLDQNLKLQIINVNQSLGKIFLDKLLEHQGIIQLEENTAGGNAGKEKDISPNNQAELQICGIYLRIFNDQDNFEVTNPQTFQQEIFNQMKINITKIQQILQQQAPNGAYDILAINQLFPTEIKAVKECIKATLSLLTRYNVQYIILNQDNLDTFFDVIELELKYSVNLSTFKVQIAKILQDLAATVQGSKILMQSKIFIKFIITYFLNCSSLPTQYQSQFLNIVQKIARNKENLEILVKERIVAALLLNILKKESLKQAYRVQIVEVINEINIDNHAFISYVSDKFPPRITQKCFADRTQKPSVEIIEIFEAVSLTSSDLLWTNLMRVEAIMVLEEEISQYLKNQDENLTPLIPLYPEYLNELQCSQIMLRIYNLVPSYTKFSELSSISHIYCKNEPETYYSYAEVLVENLIDLTEKLKNQFIKLQEENMVKTKEIPNNLIDDNHFSEAHNIDPSLQEFDRVSISYITALTSLMHCLEYIILQEKRQIKQQYFKGICNQFSILSENKSHSHIKSTVLQIAYLLKDQPNIQKAFIDSNLFVHISQALAYSLDSPQEQDCLTLSNIQFIQIYLRFFINLKVEEIIIMNLLIKLVRDKDIQERKAIVELNMKYCLPIICKLFESIDEDNSFMKSYIIGYCADMLKSGYFLEEISQIIDQTTLSSKQLAASKNVHCEWVNLWRVCIINYDGSNNLSDQQQRLYQEKFIELQFQLPIQSEYSIQPLPFPPQKYLDRQQQVEDFKLKYEKDNSLIKTNSNMNESIIQSIN